MKSLLLVSCFASASLLVGCGSGEGTGDDDVTVDGSVTPQPDGGQVVVPQGEKITLSASTATIPAGAEEEWCEVVELPNADAIKVHHIKLSIDEGVSHHAIVQLITPGSLWAQATVGQKFKGGGCSIPGSAVPILIGTQKPVIEFQFPDDVYYPVGAKQRLLFNYHYINLNSAPQPVNMKLELWHNDVARNVKAGSLFYNWTDFAAVNPGQMVTQRKDCAPFTAAQTIMTLNGHTHKLGMRFEGFKVHGGVDEKVYDNTDWDNPKYQIYTPPLQLAAGDSLSFSCTWMNTTGNPVSFGVMAKDEMCILGGYIYPTDRLTVECGR